MKWIKDIVKLQDKIEKLYADGERYKCHICMHDYKKVLKCICNLKCKCKINVCKRL